MMRQAFYAAAAFAALSSLAQAEPFDGYDKAVAINSSVNSMTEYTYEKRLKYYVPFEIMKPGGKGNCGDFAVLKCHKLVEAGFTPARLSLIQYKLWDGQGHAVCVVDGKWAMDWTDQPVHVDKASLGAVGDISPWHVYARWEVKR